MTRAAVLAAIRRAVRAEKYIISRHAKKEMDEDNEEEWIQ